MNLRVGHGYDVHQLKDGLSLVIGGESIPFEKGIVAHSDGDVLAHTIIDAILGATNLGDIGQLFPNDNKWKNVSGIDMLKLTFKHIQKHYPHFKILNIDEQKISIKATTTDKLGFIGNKLGIASESICLVMV